MSNFFERLLIGAFLLVVNLGVIIFGSRLAVFCLVLVISSISILELFTCLDPGKAGRNRILTLIANFFFQFAAYQNLFDLFVSVAVLFFIFLFMLSVVHKYREFDDLFLTLFVNVYASLFSAFALFFPPEHQFYLLVVLAVSWGTDTFAYVFGMLFGRTPLTDISPKKTREGAVGGIIGAIGLTVLVSLFFETGLPLVRLIPLAIVGSISAQLGDLFASRLKRKMQIKDFGTILRAHGGIMDRYDSVQFALPVVWVMYRLLTQWI